MAAVLKTTYPEDFMEKHQDPKRSERFVHIPVPEEAQKVVAYSKVESQNIMRSDRITAVEKELWEEFTGMPPLVLAATRRSPEYTAAIQVEEPDGTVRNPGVQDGFIWRYCGTYGGIVWYTHDNRQITQDEANSIIESGMGRQPQKYNLWQFRLRELILTDGPARRERLMESYEQQRARSETHMADAMTNAFQKFGEQFAGVPEQNYPTDPGELMRALGKELEDGGIVPEQLMALAESADAGLKKGK